MNSMEYQCRLAEYDERISYYAAKQKEIEHEKSRFVLEVLKNTVAAKAEGSLPPGIEVIKRN